ncbi:MAG: GNAT family N-acetyltransferase, partial [Acidobacteria bacterium]|nr:GNAT family N-acetyltransferase [Acidobacteriota bacterium]
PAPESPALPAGYRLVMVRTTFLEMTEPPRTPPVPLPFGCEVKRWQRPGLVEYRRLFVAVGGEWGWSGRLILKQEELENKLEAKTNEIYRIHAEGKEAGFAELDRSVAGQAEIAYFGLLPAFIGQGLGRFFLDWTIRKAWEGGTRRVWLHTCQYDHAGALAVYLKAGFTVCDNKVEMQPYAEEFLARRAGGGS